MATFVSAGDIQETLKTPGTPGKRLVEPFKSFSAAHKLPLNILEDVTVENEVEVHRHEGDLWLCLEGEATFLCGGELVEPRIHTKSDGTQNDLELKAKAITGGTEYLLKPGDWLWIPAGEPHQHGAVGTARIAIIKVPQPHIPLESVPGWHA